MEMSVEFDAFRPETPGHPRDVESNRCLDHPVASSFPTYFHPQVPGAPTHVQLEADLSGFREI